MPSEAPNIKEPLSPEACFAALKVTEDQKERLRAYVDLLRKWQQKINLVSNTTMSDVWRRHILDSAQLLPILKTRPYPLSQISTVDLGTGAGFPGLVLSILGVGPMTLVESDQRKAAFLREAARITGAIVQIENKRIETLQDFQVDLVVSRALAPLSSLLEWSFPLIKPTGLALFLKGRRVEDELTAADKAWMMAVVRHPSLTADDAVLLEITDLEPRSSDTEHLGIRP